MNAQLCPRCPVADDCNKPLIATHKIRVHPHTIEAWSKSGKNIYRRNGSALCAAGNVALTYS